MVRSVNFVRVADLNSNVGRHHPDKGFLRQQWMQEDDIWATCTGWGPTSDRTAKNPEGLDLAALLDRIESELANTALEVQWTVNFCLAGIGIHFPEYRQRTIAIGKKLDYRDYPVSKGCTFPFAAIWINEIVHRQS